MRFYAGARGQYVDVLGGASKPSPAAPGNLFNVLPKSASMPANIFVPNALGNCFYDVDLISSDCFYIRV